MSQDILSIMMPGEYSSTLTNQFRHAIRVNDTELLSRLLQSREKDGISMKQMADTHYLVDLCVTKESDDCLEVVLQCGANPNLEDGEGRISLHHAVQLALAKQHHCFDIIQKLISYGANINHQAHEGESPLMLACSYGSVANINTLIEARADPNLTDRDGETCLNVVFRHKDYGTKIIMLKTLLDAGANPDAGKKTEYMPLLQATLDGDELCAILLMEHGADPFLQSGVRPLSAIKVSVRKNSFMEQNSLFSNFMRKSFPEFDNHSGKLSIPPEMFMLTTNGLEKHLQSWMTSVKMDASMQDNPTSLAAPSI